MGRYKTVLFDLDGTLTESGPGIIRSVQYALEYFGITEEDSEKLRRFVGPPLAVSFKQFYGFDEEKAALGVKKYRERYQKTGIYENELYPGVREMLEALKAAGIKVALATSKPEVMARTVLRYFELENLFDAVAGSGMNREHETKPELIGLAFSQLGISEEDRAAAIMVGDRFYDIEGAAAAGIDSLGVYYGYAQPGELEKAGATYIAYDVAQAADILLRGGGQ